MDFCRLMPGRVRKVDSATDTHQPSSIDVNPLSTDQRKPTKCNNAVSAITSAWEDKEEDAADRGKFSKTYVGASRVRGSVYITATRWN